jgi:AcrR family transcriptional regulator
MVGTKDRIMDSSAELFRRQGYAGTGIKQILAGANAPFGSLYHFFPGGKEQLGAETIRTSGRLYGELFATIAAQAPDVASAVEEFFRGAAQTLEQTDYADACPIATVALEVASTNEQLREACSDVFDLWIDGATRYFAASGIAVQSARELALSMLCLLEGAFIFCRAMRSTEPLRVAGASAVSALRRARPLEPTAGIEPATSALQERCSTS